MATKPVTQMLPTYHIATSGEKKGKEVPTWVGIIIDDADEEMSEARESVREGFALSKARVERYEALIVSRHKNIVPTGHVLKTSFRQGVDKAVMAAVRVSNASSKAHKTGFKV